MVEIGRHVSVVATLLALAGVKRGVVIRVSRVQRVRKVQGLCTTTEQGSGSLT